MSGTEESYFMERKDVPVAELKEHADYLISEGAKGIISTLQKNKLHGISGVFTQAADVTYTFAEKTKVKTFSYSDIADIGTFLTRIHSCTDAIACYTRKEPDGKFTVQAVYSERPRQALADFCPN